MNHKQLVRRLAMWLKNSRNYSVVVLERSTAVWETPDVLGFKGPRSLLIECKVSRSDFLADSKKRFRLIAETGMGDLRFYAAPKGVLTASDIPPKWGFLEISERCVTEISEAEEQQADKRAEVAFLVSAIRRLEIACTVFVRAEPTNEEEATL